MHADAAELIAGMRLAEKRWRNVAGKRGAERIRTAEGVISAYDLRLAKPGPGRRRSPTVGSDR